jgi:hypothetical protein
MNITFEELNKNSQSIFEEMLNSSQNCILSAPIYSKPAITIPQLKHWAIDNYDLKNRPDIERIDFDKPIKVYEWHIDTRKLIKYSNLEYLENQLSLFCGYYMYDYSIEDLTYAMECLAYELAKNFVGIGRTEINFEIIIKSVFENIDAVEFRPNKTKRFLNNPYFIGQKSSVNRDLGQEKRELQSSLLEDYLSDYDYNQGKITYKKISQDLNISERTVIRYLKDGCLREIYDVVKHNSKR